MVIRNAFTVDVEDYYHVSAFECHVTRECWERYESRVERNTARILEMLDRHGVKGTFFVLGWIARKFPRLVREIQGCGHEIGSHSFWHRLIYKQSPAEFRTDLRDSKGALEDATGVPVRAYRAPSFSITSRSLWALEILVQEGIEVDSSIFPVHHDRYGIPDAPTTIHRRETPSGQLWEFPVSVKSIAGFNLPVSGGGYFRLFPASWTMRWLSQINERQNQPFVFYIHPWELDPDQPRVPIASRMSRFRHYVQLKSTAQKLEMLLSRFEFTSIREVVFARQGDPTASVSPDVQQNSSTLTGTPA